jgi:hypothetical protein
MARHGELHGGARRDDACEILHATFAATKPGQTQTVLQRQIEATDRQIDQVVYQLYNLTSAEIALVEQSTPK